MKVARRRRKSVLVNTALAAALLAGAGIAYAAVEDDGGNAPVSSRTRTAKVAKGTVMASVSASGSLSSPSDAGVSFTASGTVTKVAVKVGDKVTAGQVLAEIDTTAAQEDVDEAEAALDVAEENLAKAKKGATVTIPPTAGSGTSGGGTTGAGSGAGSGANTGTGTNSGTGTGTGTTTGTSASGKPSATATASAAAASPSPTKSTATPTPNTSTTVDAAQVAQAESALVQAQNKLAEAKRVLAGCVLKAPTDGLVASVAGKVGDTASAGSSGASSGASTGAGAGGSSGGTSGGSSSGSSSTGFVVIANPSGMEIDVSFSEADAAKVKAGQPATVTMNVDSATKRNAKVVSVNPLPDSGATSGSVKYTATIALEGDVSALRTGQTANVQVIVAQADNALYVPSAAVTGTGSAASVTVVANGAQERRTVSLGVVGDQTTQIVSGLAEGDEVVVGTMANGNSSTGNGTSRNTTGGTSGVVPGNLGGGSAVGGPVGGFPPGGTGGR